MAGICGRHRQRQTGRLISYWATYSSSAVDVFYAGLVQEGRRHLAAPTGALNFDPAELSADEAVRRELGRYIDDTPFGEGSLPTPSWTDYGPYK